MSKQNRSAFIEMLINYATNKANELGYDEVIIGEDRQKGFWGEGFTKYLEKTHGECTKEIEWRKDKETYIWFRFRFESPCLAFHWEDDAQQGYMIEFEFSDTILISTDRRYDKDGFIHKKGEVIKEFKEAPWYIAEVHLWKPTKFKDLYTKLTEDMEKLLQEINHGQQRRNKMTFEKFEEEYLRNRPTEPYCENEQPDLWAALVA